MSTPLQNVLVPHEICDRPAVLTNVGEDQLVPL
jgi:hypothetical protein